MNCDYHVKRSVVVADGSIAYTYRCQRCCDERNVFDDSGPPIRQCVRLGLGDVVAGMTKAVGIKPCISCDRRREWLNKLGRKVSRTLKGG